MDCNTKRGICSAFAVHKLKSVSHAKIALGGPIQHNLLPVLKSFVFIRIRKIFHIGQLKIKSFPVLN